jgi:penicillin-binding protein 1A
MGDLTAGERLVPPLRPRGGSGGEPPHDGNVPPPPSGGGGKPPRYRIVRRSPLRWIVRIAFIGFAMIVVAGGIGAAFAYHTYERIVADLPTVDGLKQYQPPVMSRIYAGDDHLVAELAKERRIFVPSNAIPDLLKQSFVSAEDQKFWTHHGVDPSAILRAAMTDLQQLGRNRRPIGASTITQQVARNMLLGTNERTFERKVKEAILAMKIEQVLPKERILELYLNEIYFGLQSYGVAAAAQTYFNKSLDELTLAEDAFLASLPKAPNNYNPFRFPEAARNRRDFVLDRMAEDHAITPEQAAAAKVGPVVTSQFRRPETVPGAEWFGEDVRRQMVERFGAEATNEGGLVVRTSLDPALQHTMDSVLRAGLMKYDRQHGGYRGPVARLDAASVRTGWTHSLPNMVRPPGMLPEWKLAAVLDTTGDSARLGWVDPNGQTHEASLSMGDVAWARPNRNGVMGGSPRRMTDVVQVGDVVMADPAPAAAPPTKAAARGDRLYLRQVPQIQGAMVTLDPTTGRVLAMSGGWSFEASQFNRATQAARQPGSSFKPMVYLTAMQQGISPSQKVLDGPFVLDQGAAGVWRPGNYESGFAGPISLHMALEKSLNLVTVRLAQAVGMQAVADNAVAFHVVDQMTHYLPNALGAVDTTVMRQAGAYGSLSQGGREVVPTLVDSVQDRDGHVIWRAPALACTGCDNPTRPPSLEDRRKRIADAPSVFQVVTMMRGVVLHGTGYEAGKGLNREIAGKTGTTQDFNDAWFVGFTPDLVTAVWIGFDTPASLGKDETGGSVAAPIWHDFMEIALKNRPVLPFRVPDGVKLATWSGNTIDAFKPDQVPGASGPTIGGGDGGGGGGGGSGGDAGGVTASSSGTGTGLDSGMGGLY